jgi:hypothetical protein
MKWLRFPIAIAFAFLLAFPALAQDANLHISKIPGWPLQHMDWKTARDGGYKAEQGFLLTVTIEQESENHGPGGGWIYQGILHPYPAGGWVIVATPEQVPYFERGMEVHFFAHYSETIEGQMVNRTTGEMGTVRVPVFKADQWGINVVK